MKKFVIDTNVVVHGLITKDRSVASVRVLERMLKGSFTFVLSPDLVRHYEETLNRPSLAALHGLQRTQVEALVATLAAAAIIKDPGHSGIRMDDRGDQCLIDLAISDSKHVLVAGDLRHQRAKLELAIVSPSGLLRLLDRPLQSKAAG